MQAAKVVPDRPDWLRTLLFAQLLLSPLVLSRSTLESFEFPKVALLVTVAIVCGAAGLGALASSWRAGHRRPGRPFASLARAPLALGVCLFVISAAASTLWSISSRTSWQGAHESDAGLVTVLAYATLFFATREACRDATCFRQLLHAPVLAAVPVIAYALVQFLGMDPLEWRRVSEFEGVQRSASTMGHANFLAAFLAMVVPFLVYYGAAAAGQGRRRTVWLVVLTGVLAVVVIVWSLSRAGWLALLVAGVVLAVGWPRSGRPLLKRRDVAIGAIVALVVLALFTSRPAGRELRVAVRDRVSSIAAGRLGARAEIWRAAAEMFRAHLVTGVGLDCFQLAFQRHRSVAFWRLEGHHTPQKAHSEPLHVLATQGALGGLALFLLGVGTWRAARRALRQREADRALLVAALASLAAFVAQDLFSFTVAGIGTLAVTLLAMLSRLGEGPADGGGRPDPSSTAAGDRRFLALCVAGVAAVAVWILVVRPYRASLAATRAVAALPRNPPLARAAAREAVGLDPGQPLYWLQLGASAEILAQGSAPAARPALYAEARSAVSRARDLVPADAYNHAMLGRVLTAMSTQRPPLASPRDAANAFAEALARDPSNPFLIARAARSAADLDDFDRADALAQRGETIDPQYGAFPWARGYRRLALGMQKRPADPAAAAADFEAAAALLARAVTLEWREDESGRALAAHHLAVALFVLGRYEEAGAAARRAVEIDPMFVDARFNLGRIAERLGDRETARAQYRRVLATNPMHQPARAALAALEAGRPASAERPPQP